MSNGRIEFTPSDALVVMQVAQEKLEEAVQTNDPEQLRLAHRLAAVAYKILQAAVGL